jgi:hypothetical protein
MGILHQRLGDDDLAILELEKVQDHAEMEVFTDYALGVSNLRKKWPFQALDNFKRCLQVSF